MAVLVEPEWVVVELQPVVVEWVVEAMVVVLQVGWVAAVSEFLVVVSVSVAPGPMLGGTRMVHRIGEAELFAPMASAGVELLLGAVAGDGAVDLGEVDHGDGMVVGVTDLGDGDGAAGVGMGPGTRISIGGTLRLIWRAVPVRHNTDPPTGGRLHA